MKYYIYFCVYYINKKNYDEKYYNYQHINLLYKKPMNLIRGHHLS